MKARLVLVLLVAGLLGLPAQARLGESLKQITARYGKPASQPAKNQAMWLFEEGDGQVMYTVTFNEAGSSMAEGFKPARRGTLAKDTAETFIHGQLAGRAKPDGGRVVKTGEQYAFAGKTLVCGAKEFVFVDEAADLLVVWNQDYPGTIMVLSAEMVRRM